MVSDAGQEDEGQGKDDSSGLHVLLVKVQTWDITWSEQSCFSSWFCKEYLRPIGDRSCRVVWGAAERKSAASHKHQDNGTIAQGSSAEAWIELPLVHLIMYHGRSVLGTEVEPRVYRAAGNPAYHLKPDQGHGQECSTLLPGLGLCDSRSRLRFLGERPLTK